MLNVVTKFIIVKTKIKANNMRNVATIEIVSRQRLRTILKKTTKTLLQHEIRQKAKKVCRDISTLSQQ